MASGSAGETSWIAIIGGATRGNAFLVEGLRQAGHEAALLRPDEARAALREGDVAIARLDVLPTLDGVEEGLGDVVAMGLGGIRVINSARSLVAAHDKLVTAQRLDRAGLPHPRSTHVRELSALRALTCPVVVKPRFGSWGADVMRCDTPAELAACAEVCATRSWFRRHGALAQELIPSAGRDLRVLVARGSVVGAVERVAAAGEWRTNATLGGRLEPHQPAPAHVRLALAAARAVGGELIGVDLLPAADGGAVVVELNAAVDFRGTYSQPGRDVYADVAAALQLPRGAAALPAR